MAKGKWTEDRFRKNVRIERGHREWTQEQMAKRLSDKGIPMHWTTIAKIESGGRAVRIDEASAIADLLGVSVDMLLGRRARPKSDLVHALRAALDAGQQATWQVSSLEDTLRERVVELAEVDVEDRHADLVADLDRACKQLDKASQALTVAMRDRKRDKVIKTNTAKILLQMDEEPDDDKA